MTKQENYLQQRGNQCIHQVVKGAMATETLALVDAVEASFWLSKLLRMQGVKLIANSYMKLYIQSVQY